MKKYYLIFIFLLLGQVVSYGKYITANSFNYSSYLSGLSAGDTLYLSQGIYTNNLTLNGINGADGKPVVIMGSSNLYTTIFKANSGVNTVSITKCSFLVIKNLQLDGQNLAVDAVKAEGTTGNWAHHITVEYLNIINYGNNQQIVGISTKCHAWNWVIRKNKIIGAGTGMYLGNSNGDKPFVNGLIEYNYIANTLGYNIEIKHQFDTVRDNYAGTAVTGKTIIRHNVFSKETNGSTGASARPILLVGGFPLTGYGKDDQYEIYGNLFWQNPTEALFQGTGNIHMYNNIFVNTNDPSGFRAVYITPQNGVKPQNIRIFHNTVWVNNSSGGIRMYDPDTAYDQYCNFNAVFAAQPITNFTNATDNITDAYANAGQYVLSANSAITGLDLFPKNTKLSGTLQPHTQFTTETDYDLDFNGNIYDWTYRGAYSGNNTNPGWHLKLDTMPDMKSTAPTSIFSDERDGIKIYPNPASTSVSVTFSELQNFQLRLTNLVGEIIYRSNFTGTSVILDISNYKPGIYLLYITSDNKTTVKKILRQ